MTDLIGWEPKMAAASISHLVGFPHHNHLVQFLENNYDESTYDFNSLLGVASDTFLESFHKR